MINVQVDSLTFTFSPSWRVCKYDEWTFHQKQFSKMWPGVKAVDLIAIESQVVWFIEAKDYRQQPRTKTIDLADEVAKKVFCTLAAMLPAKVNASDAFESHFAKGVAGSQKLCVVLHLEQPMKTSKLFPRAIDPSKVQLKLRGIIKPIDPHSKVVESAQMQGLAWTVT
jgi:hypothetical protein